MRIISPSFEILNPADKEQGIAALQRLEFKARISHRSEEKQSDDSYIRFLNFVLMSKGDWSIAESETASVIIITDRGSADEILRHRLASFTVESTRFVNYKKVGEISVIKPTNYKEKDDTVWMETVAKSCWGYTVLMERGWAPEDARSVLSFCLACKFAMTSNFRNWRYFFQARTSREVHPDVRRITIPLLTAFKERIPIIFDDIVAEEKQSIAFSKPR